jgi:hypothetical protein
MIQLEDLVGNYLTVVRKLLSNAAAGSAVKKIEDVNEL